jgi:cellulose synthase/poly-beta-1,6-N-acetylglucosamine synthase-like glycosyltransferase
MVAWVFFLAGAGFALYIVAGYPLVLAVLARWRPKPIRKQFSEKSVTVLLAAYNGEPWIRAKLESILQLDYPRERMEILVVSDGSTDETDAIASQFQTQGVELLRVPHAGKAAALNAGMAQARGEILFFTDVRQRLEPDALRQLVSCL